MTRIRKSMTPIEIASIRASIYESIYSSLPGNTEDEKRLKNEFKNDMQNMANRKLPHQAEIVAAMSAAN